MSQSLLGKPKPRETPEEQVREAEEYEIDTPKGFTDGQDYAVFEVRYARRQGLGDADEHLTISTTIEYHNHMGSSYGSGGRYDTTNLDELANDIREFFKSLLDSPYIAYDKGMDEKYGDNIFSRFGCDIKTENMALQVSDKAREYLKKNGFDIEALCRDIDGMKASRKNWDSEYGDKVFYFLELDDTREKAEDEWSGIINDVRGHGMGNSALLHFVKKDEVKARLNELTKTLEGIRKDYEMLHREFYGWERGFQIDDKGFQGRLKEALEVLG